MSRRKKNAPPEQVGTRVGGKRVVIAERGGAKTTAVIVTPRDKVTMRFAVKPKTATFIVPPEYEAAMDALSKEHTDGSATAPAVEKSHPPAGDVTLFDIIDGDVPFTAIYAMEPLERSDLVDGGVSARFLPRLARELSVAKETIYTLLGASRATVERKLKADDPLSAAESERAIGIARLVGQVQQIVQESGDPEGFDAGRWVAQFLDVPHPALGGRRPADLMRTNEGSRMVSTLVAQMQSGAYA